MNRLKISLGIAVFALLIGCGKTPYDNPIGNNSQQPDRILFDQAVEHLEKHKYEVARLTLQTLINTYPDPVGVALGIDPDILISEYIPSLTSASAEAEAA